MTMTKACEQPQTPTWEVTLRIEDSGLLRLIADVYAMSDENTKQYIEVELRRLVGHAVDGLKG